MIRFKAKADDAQPARSDKAVKKAAVNSTEGSQPEADAGTSAQSKTKPTRKDAGGATTAAKSRTANKAAPDLLDLGSDGTS